MICSAATRSVTSGSTSSGRYRTSIAARELVRIPMRLVRTLPRGRDEAAPGGDKARTSCRPWRRRGERDAVESEFSAADLASTSPNRPSPPPIWLPPPPIWLPPSPNRLPPPPYRQRDVCLLVRPRPQVSLLVQLLGSSSASSSCSWANDSAASSTDFSLVLPCSPCCLLIYSGCLPSCYFRVCLFHSVSSV